MRLLAIDPGASAGFALFVDGILLYCGTEYTGEFVDILVIERPEIYRDSKVDPNKIITLAINAGWRARGIPHDKLVWVLPKRWKGQIKKTPRLSDYIIYKRYVKGTITPGWNQDWTKKEKFDVTDAIGIGKWMIKQL